MENVKSNIYVENNHCVVCGKALDVEKKDFLYVKVVKKYFPVCSESCQSFAEDYLKKDKIHKKHFYWMFMICALFTLIGALFNKSVVSFIGVIIGGLAFLIFPYPISSFESFTYWPIKKINVFVRILGVFIILVGLFFLFEVIFKGLNVDFYKTNTLGRS